MRTLIVIIAISAFMFQVTSADSDQPLDQYCAEIRDGRLVVVFQGSVLTSNITLDNGAQIKTDGTIIKEDGTTTVLKQGECIGKDGKLPDKKPN